MKSVARPRIDQTMPMRRMRISLIVGLCPCDTQDRIRSDLKKGCIVPEFAEKITIIDRLNQTHFFAATEVFSVSSVFSVSPVSYSDSLKTGSSLPFSSKIRGEERKKS